jgi:hypothetical protein
VLGAGSSRVHGAAAAYASRGVELATHDVFLAMTACTLAALGIVLSLPRRWEPLRLDADERAASPAVAGEARSSVS